MGLSLKEKKNILSTQVEKTKSLIKKKKSGRTLVKEHVMPKDYRVTFNIFKER